MNVNQKYSIGISILFTLSTGYSAQLITNILPSNGFIKPKLHNLISPANLIAAPYGIQTKNCANSLQNCTLLISEKACLPAPGSILVVNNSKVNAQNISASSTDYNYVNYVIQNNGCPASLPPGGNCVISFYTNVSSAFLIPNVSIKGSNTNTTMFDLSAFQCVQTATISTTPSSVNFVVGNTATVTIMNTSLTTEVNDLQVSIPVGSLFSIDATTSTCTSGGNLSAQQSCNFVFQASGSDTEEITIQGNNSNVSQVTLTAGNAPVLSITGSTQENRYVNLDTGTELQLTITNAGGSFPTNISATLPMTSSNTPWSNTTIDTSECQNLQPGNSCTLTVNTTSPNVPGVLTITGTNQANTLTTWIAVFMGGGIIFYVDSTGLIKVGQQADSSESSLWQSGSVSTIITDGNDGVTNTSNIVNSSATNTAAAVCFDLPAIPTEPGDTGWYLPAICELAGNNEGTTFDGCSTNNQNNNMTSLFSFNPGSFISNGGYYYYWSSSESEVGKGSYAVFFVFLYNSPGTAIENGTAFPVRCIRAFTPSI